MVADATAYGRLPGVWHERLRRRGRHVMGMECAALQSTRAGRHMEEND